jgi:hypothetical protein
VLSDKYPDIAYQVFQRDCLIPLGPCVAPLGPAKDGEDVMTVSLESAGETPIEVTVHGGELINLPLPVGQKAKLVVRPTRSFDLGEGKGKVIEEIIDGGVVGVILDGRGRPLQLPDDDTERNAKLLRWLQAIGAVNVNPV